MPIAVTGAAGQLGQLVADELMARIPPSEVVLISRSPEKLARYAARGAAVRHGDFDAPSSLSAAFEGVERALIISTFGPGNPVPQHRTAFEGAARAGVRHLVYTSFANAVEGNPAPASMMQHESEKALRATDVSWTILRNALYAELRVDIAPTYVADGHWTTNTGKGAHAFVSRADCAAAAAGALTAKGHEGKVYEVTGPERIDADGYTALLESFGGRAIARLDLDDASFERYRTEFMARPEASRYLELYTGTGTAIRENHLDQQTNAVEELSGHAPRSLRALFEERRR